MQTKKDSQKEISTLVKSHKETFSASIKNLTQSFRLVIRSGAKRQAENKKGSFFSDLKNR